MNKYSFQKSFTLVEILVSAFIFSLIFTVGIGILTSGIKFQKRAILNSQLLSQMSYVLEYMSRAIRMAKKDLTNQCAIGAKMNYGAALNGPGIRFKNYQNKCQEFYLEGNQLKEWREGQGYSSLTSTDFEVTNFGIEGQDSWDQDDFLQPRVTLFFEVKPKGKEFPKLKLQTTISQRNIDIKK